MTKKHEIILVTGGAGYIGSHTCVALLDAGRSVIALDDLSNSSTEAVARVETITGKKVPLVMGDIRDQKTVEATIRNHGCTGVIHLAGKKAVQESWQQPQSYYDTNVLGTISVVRALAACNVKRIVFGSTATVYGVPQNLPLREDHPCNPESPYATTKLTVEDMLRDLGKGDAEWGIGILRYFNPIGAHASGLIGEDPKGIPNNLMPFVAQVATGQRTRLNVWGNDYLTSDGTGVRDYLHVMDVAAAHVRALDHVYAGTCFTANLGTGKGTSVLELVRLFAKASCRDIPYDIQPRRAGDVAAYYADPGYAEKLLGWKAMYSLEAMCEDQWRWQSQNPNGYNHS